MSIVTKTGDKGTTSLMYGRRVRKDHPRVEAYGTVDELNAALGMARATCDQQVIGHAILTIQRHLVPLMGELATAAEDVLRYHHDGYAIFNSALTAEVEQLVHQIEAEGLKFQGWATPGANACAAALDLARTICRRAERAVCALQETEGIHPEEALIYLNRASDLLWLLARKAEQSPTRGSK